MMIFAALLLALAVPSAAMADDRPDSYQDLTLHQLGQECAYRRHVLVLTDQLLRSGYPLDANPEREVAEASGVPSEWTIDHERDYYIRAHFYAAAQGFDPLIAYARSHYQTEFIDACKRRPELFFRDPIMAAPLLDFRTMPDNMADIREGMNAH